MIQGIRRRTLQSIIGNESAVGVRGARERRFRRMPIRPDGALSSHAAHPPGRRLDAMRADGYGQWAVWTVWAEWAVWVDGHRHPAFAMGGTDSTWADQQDLR